MDKKMKKPSFLFEASWEVCNKVGGIYTVLSTHAKTLSEELNDKLIFVGPDLIGENVSSSLFTETTEFAKWKEHFQSNENLNIKIGRWNIPSSPLAILVDFKPLFEKKNEIYGLMWEKFHVDSLHAYGDYDESEIFAVAAAMVVESFYNYYLKDEKNVVFHAHEWMLGMSVLYLQHRVPAIATVFTTHATTVGRSIAANNKPLYDYLSSYNGDQMARELNVEAKHSVEKQTAHFVDCFTTVSEITNNECQELLDKPVDVVLVNGFEDDFVPSGTEFNAKRRDAKASMLNVANKLLGCNLKDDTLIVGTSGRYEFRNKGIDVFIDALNQLNDNKQLKQNVLAFIAVPGWVSDPRQDLIERLNSDEKFTSPLHIPLITHWLHNFDDDKTLGMLNHLNMQNRENDKVKVIFVPCYLDGADGIFNIDYYDFLIGQDISVYASYYEPWGYTPLESIAFRIPTVTTNLAGFGSWANQIRNHPTIFDGVEVIDRSDHNYGEVVNHVANVLLEYSLLEKSKTYNIRRKANTISKQALWKNFIKNYYIAYDIAIKKAQLRQEKEEINN